jgi:hypothetical protein
MCRKACNELPSQLIELSPGGGGNKRLFVAVSGTFLRLARRRSEAHGDIDADTRAEQPWTLQKNVGVGLIGTRWRIQTAVTSPYTFGRWKERK